MSKYFVWVSGLTGSQPQIWHDDMVNGSGKAQATIFKKELAPHEENCSVDTLAEIYKEYKDAPT